VNAVFRTEYFPLSKIFGTNLSKTNVVLAVKTKKNEWFFAGIGADGLRLKVISESGMTGSTPESRTTQLITMIAEENMDEGLARVWYAGVDAAARNAATQAAIDTLTNP
jgi:hypothetical protein